VSIGSSQAIISYVDPTTTNKNIVIGTQTIQPGEATTINGVQVFVPSSGQNIVVGSSTMMVKGPKSKNFGPQILTLPSTAITAVTDGGFVIALGLSGMTVYAGSSAVVYSGTTYSIGSATSIAVVNDITHTLDQPFPITTSPLSGPPILTLGGKTFTGDITDSSAYFIIPTSILASATTSTTYSPVLTLPNHQEITAFVSNNATAFLLGSDAILTPGGQVTLSGTTYRLPTSGSMIAIDGLFTTLGGLGNSTKITNSTKTTTTNATATSSTQQNTGDAIAGGIGFTSPPKNSIASSKLIPTHWLGPWQMIGYLVILFRAIC
jgi:hypothetical protein